jgi:tRNA(Ile)-lysidine synthase
LDPQKLKGNLVLRNWRAGDNFWPLGGQKVRKLKELFREGKVPEVQRRGWPVLLCGGQIVWVRGFPPSLHAAATAQSQQMLVIEEEPTPA